MKDLAFCIEFVEYNALFLSTPGLRMLELYAPLYETPATQIMTMPLSLVKTITYHNFSKNTLDFWHCVVRLMAQYIGKEIKVLLLSIGLHFFRALVEFLSWVVEINTAVDVECSAIEASRDPPSIFVPLPKIECNSCARSDLPIRSLIFSERIPMYALNVLKP
ncbi:MULTISPECIES: hypothetical protein [unclassified Microcoleus]|uniref:hypothetical protein n=1 Tax=unclassified Microcoleus TaxID=2642155 RepID=UPI002FD4C8CF